MNAAAIYEGSDGEATRALYARLEKLGPLGVIAMNLFRACKASQRAKVYRGKNKHGRFRDQAYEKKEWSLHNLCGVLVESDLVWGWKEDPAQTFHKWVLYIELPTGQVSFHAAMPIAMAALNGGFKPYHGEWDGAHLSAERIVRYTECVLNGETFKILAPAVVTAPATPMETAELFS